MQLEQPERFPLWRWVTFCMWDTVGLGYIFSQGGVDALLNAVENGDNTLSITALLWLFVSVVLGAWVLMGTVKYLRSRKASQRSRP